MLQGILDKQFKDFISNIDANEMHPFALNIYKCLFNKYFLEPSVSNQTNNCLYLSRIINPNFSEQESTQLIIDFLFQSMERKMAIEGLMAYFLLPEPNNDFSKEFVANLMMGLSKASETLNIPYITTNAVYTNDTFRYWNITLNCIGSISPVINDNQIITSRRIGTLNCKRLVQIPNDIFYVKLIKEFYQEVSQKCNCRLIYNNDNVYSLLIQLVDYLNFSTAITFNNESIDNLLEDAPLFIYNAEEEKDIKSIARKWGIEIETIAFSVPSTNCIIRFGADEISINKQIIKQIKDNLNITRDTTEAKDTVNTFNVPWLNRNDNLKETALKYIQLPNIASKRWIKEQFNRISPGNNLSMNFHTDVPVIQNSNKRLITTTIHCHINHPGEGLYYNIQNIVSESIRKTISTGATPESVNIVIYTDECFLTHDERSNISGYVSGICKTFGIEDFSYTLIPVKEFCWNRGNILPIVITNGTIEKNKNLVQYNFKTKGDLIYLLGRSRDGYSNEYLKLNGYPDSIQPNTHVDEEIALQNTLKLLIQKHLVKSVHSINHNGLYIALVEASVHSRFGFDITTDAEIDIESFLYSPSGSRAIITVSPEDEDSFIDLMLESKFPFTMLGHVTKEEFRIDDISFGFISDIRKIYLRSLGNKYN